MSLYLLQNYSVDSSIKELSEKLMVTMDQKYSAEEGILQKVHYFCSGSTVSLFYYKIIQVTQV